jgi:phage N-6-adenine-methyltransferase
MKDLAVHFSSETCEWSTPQWLFDALAREFAFTLDPCATRENAKCPRFFTREDDGLVQDWGDEVVFMNPPYGAAIGRWMRKAYESSRAGATVVCLVPARTDTAWWHLYAMKGEVRLLRGRLKFGNAQNSAPFPSAIVIFRPPLFTLKEAAAKGPRRGGETKLEVEGKAVGRERASYCTVSSTVSAPLSAHRKLRLNGESASPCP